MARFEFFCHACEQPFSKILTADEYEEGVIACSNCGSEEVEQQMRLAAQNVSGSFGDAKHTRYVLQQDCRLARLEP